jgi:hypothetical protein
MEDGCGCSAAAAVRSVALGCDSNRELGRIASEPGSEAE